MEMTYKQYIDNPLGKRNAVFSQRDLYKGLYTEKFNTLMLREAGKIEYILYVDKSHDRYVAHIKVPSETVKNFYYDAVILFYTNDSAVHSSNSLQNYNVKFFSNDPAFVFTYLRVFLKNDLFFEVMKPRSSKLALKKDPKQTNPYEVPGYSKILYFAYLFMQSRNLFSKHSWSNAQPYSARKLLATVEHTDEKIANRQELGEKQAKQQAAEKRKEIKEKNSTRFEATPKRNIKNMVKSAPIAKKAKTAKIAKKK